MKILKRNGDTFRPLSWSEYFKERLKDGGFSESENDYFDEVTGYCKSADAAKSFSSHWYKKLTQQPNESKHNQKP